MANAVEPKTDRASIIEEALLTRGQFLELCVASVVGLSLLVLAGCGGSQDGGGGGGNGKRDNKDAGGGGGGY
jgi:hypothetical protein